MTSEGEKHAREEPDQTQNSEEPELKRVKTESSEKSSDVNDNKEEQCDDTVAPERDAENQFKEEQIKMQEQAREDFEELVTEGLQKINTAYTEQKLELDEIVTRGLQKINTDYAKQTKTTNSNERWKHNRTQRLQNALKLVDALEDIIPGGEGTKIAQQIINSIFSTASFHSGLSSSEPPNDVSTNHRVRDRSPVSKDSQLDPVLRSIYEKCLHKNSD